MPGVLRLQSMNLALAQWSQLKVAALPEHHQLCSLWNGCYLISQVLLGTGCWLPFRFSSTCSPHEYVCLCKCKKSCFCFFSLCVHVSVLSTVLVCPSIVLVCTGPPYPRTPRSSELWVLFGGADENSHLSWENSGHGGHTIFSYNRPLPPVTILPHNYKPRMAKRWSSVNSIGMAQNRHLAHICSSRFLHCVVFPE